MSRRRITRARVQLGRAGVSMPTGHQLAFQADHALARDAVHAVFDPDRLAERLRELGHEVVVAPSQVRDRGVYLRRPDAGRRLSPDAVEMLRARAQSQAAQGESGWDVVLVVSDGLSSLAVDANGADLVHGIVTDMSAAGLRVGPIVVVPFARVGVMDEVGVALGAASVAIVIGERPGLSAPDSLSVYFECAPRPDLDDSDRNCVSNIGPHGLSPAVAAEQVCLLVTAGLRQHLSGTGLKVEYPRRSELGTAPGSRPSSWNPDGSER